MLDISRRGTMRGTQSVANPVAGDQPGKIRCTPNVATARRITGAVRHAGMLGRHERRAHRAERARAASR